MSRASKTAARRAKRVLEEAVPLVGNHVVVIAPGVNGLGYIGTSLPTRTGVELESLIELTSNALKKMRSWQRKRIRDDIRAARGAE